MTDSKYFTTTKKGEIFELKSELNSDKKEKKREAVKKVSSLYKIIKLRFFTYSLILNDDLRLSIYCSYIEYCMFHR